MSGPLFDAPWMPRLEVLLEEIQTGVVQIPQFQRSFQWTIEQQVELLDSVNRGLPIGSLTVWRSSGKEPLECYKKLGPFPLTTTGQLPGRRTYLLDGLQRIWTLYVLLRTPNEDEAARNNYSWVYYDLLADSKMGQRANYGFHVLKAEEKKDAPPTWVPLSIFLTKGGIYAFRRELGENRRDLGRAAEQMARRFRDYPVPIVPVLTDDVNLAHESFRRINRGGTPMTDVDLLGALTFEKPYDVRKGMDRIHDKLVSLGWGEWSQEKNVLFEVLKAAYDLEYQRDPVTAIRDHLAEEGDGAIFDKLVLAAERVVLLLQRWKITSPRLLPYAYQFVALMDAARCGVDVRDEPLALQLQTWFWATTYSEYFATLDSARRWKTLQHIRDLANMTPNVKPIPADLERLVKPLPPFDETSARSIGLTLLLAENKPLDSQGLPIDAGSLVAAEGSRSLALIIPDASADEPANRFLAHPNDVEALRRFLRNPPDPNDQEAFERYQAICERHWIEPEAAKALAKSPFDEFFDLRRRKLIEKEVTRLRAWGLYSPEMVETPTTRGVWHVYAPDASRAAYFEDVIRGAGMIPAWEHALVQQRIDQAWLEAHARELNGEISAVLASQKLVEKRLQVMAPQGYSEEMGPIRLAVATHIRNQVPHPETALVYGTLEPPTETYDADWQSLVLRLWDTRMGTPLVWARDALAAQGMHEVMFHLRCHLGAAMRAGSIFHFRTGFSVACEQNGETWDLDLQKVRAEGPLLQKRVQENGAGGEIHLLLSMTQNVEDAYRQWQRQTGVIPAWCLHFEPKKGWGREALDHYDVVDAALQVSEAILTIPQPDDEVRQLRRIRIFCAGPVAFALALGRAMNTWGDVITMDYSKGLGIYFESFRFRA